MSSGASHALGGKSSGERPRPVCVCVFAYVIIKSFCHLCPVIAENGHERVLDMQWVESRVSPRGNPSEMGLYERLMEVETLVGLLR